jgi:hypothetical protein
MGYREHLGAPYAPYGCYPCRGVDAWIVIACSWDGMRARLSKRKTSAPDV